MYQYTPRAASNYSQILIFRNSCKIQFCKTYFISQLRISRIFWGSAYQPLTNFRNLLCTYRGPLHVIGSYKIHFKAYLSFSNLGSQCHTVWHSFRPVVCREGISALTVCTAIFSIFLPMHGAQNCFHTNIRNI